MSLQVRASWQSMQRGLPFRVQGRTHGPAQACVGQPGSPGQQPKGGGVQSQLGPSLLARAACGSNSRAKTAQMAPCRYGVHHCPRLCLRRCDKAHMSLNHDERVHSAAPCSPDLSVCIARCNCTTQVRTGSNSIGKMV
jgi:hypothetical protein